MTSTLDIATYNIHKGFSHFNRRMVIHELRDKLHALNADVVFLQEVLGIHESHATRYANWPSKPQHEFLAGSIWTEYAYGKNAVYEEGHHGNAILSRYPIVRWENQDISAHRFESRGMLHCEIEVPDWKNHLHCLNVHLGLFGKGRRRQIAIMCERIQRVVPPEAPLIIAGDFNDWRAEADHLIAAHLQVDEVFQMTTGRPARSFPSAIPVFRLDRIYVRGFHVLNAEVHHGPMWSRISDHAALSAKMVLK